MGTSKTTGKTDGKQTQTPENTPSLRGLFDSVLSTLQDEIRQLPEILEQVTPEKRLDFISKNLPLLLKYRESGEGNPGGFEGLTWGD